MGSRFVVLAALAALAAFVAAILTWPPARAAAAQVGAPASFSPARVQAPPPMFSPWYAAALRDILELGESDIARLEQRLAADPDDFPSRLKLMAYHQRADRSGRPEDRAKRVQHTLWLIEHHPDSELLHSYVSRFTPGELSPGDYRHAARLWDTAAKAAPGKAALYWNAASFFQDLDPELHMRYLEATAAADPNHPFALRPLAHLYASTILKHGPLAARAQAGLDASKNVWVLGNAAHMFQSQFNQTRDARAAQLAERYFLRAKALDPSLDRRRSCHRCHRRMSGRGKLNWMPNASGRRASCRRPATSAAFRWRRFPNCRRQSPECCGRETVECRNRRAAVARAT